MPWTGNSGQRGGHEVKVVRAQAGEGLAVRMKGLLRHGEGAAPCPPCSDTHKLGKRARPEGTLEKPQGRGRKQE